MRMADKSSTSLPESDYLAILDLIQKFHDCRSRRDLRNCIQSHLLPLVNCQCSSYGFFDLDFASNPSINMHHFGTVGFPDEESKLLSQMTPSFKSLATAVASTNQRIFSHDIHISPELYKKEFKLFFKENPQYRQENFPTINKIERCVALIDRPDMVVGMGIQRLSPNNQAFTLRDVRVLELLHPHLIQSIKTIGLNEELKRFKAFAESLAEVPIAMALISLDHRVIYSNKSFDKLLSVHPGHRIPKDFSSLLHQEINRFNPPFDVDPPSIELPFYNLQDGVFRVVLTQLNPAGEIEEQCWLLKLKPAVEPFTKMNLLMQEKGLTAREMEIASLIRDGMNDQEIGDRLFISIHTVKNHIKNIHQKLNVHTRGQLVSLLNR